MVAGFEWTRTTWKPSSRAARHACDPEKSNSAAWPIMIGPEPMMRILRTSVRLGMLRDLRRWTNHGFHGDHGHRALRGFREIRGSVGRQWAPATLGNCPGVHWPFLHWSTIWRNWSKKWFESHGPGLASGWYCIVKMGRLSWRTASTTPSFGHFSHTTRPVPLTLAASTWKPWFWLVMRTTPVNSSRVGMLAPRWPNFILEVLAPQARETSWLP